MFNLKTIDNNSSAGNIEVGNTNEFVFDGTVFYFGRIRSSIVKSIEIIEKDLIVQTKNSKYVFEKVLENA